ncbi:hypothetical protein CSUI_009840 [Cystoisospora suis]|uniref:Uncharacterized protein n=1 Tax=Cystoisospora suis TaxID=483139 RepID=A0A2C6KJ07_9APIC|nr:hypothetical protein CSUI_009840 [Cystoisospora suis]
MLWNMRHPDVVEKLESLKAPTEEEEEEGKMRKSDTFLYMILSSSTRAITPFYDDPPAGLKQGSCKDIHRNRYDGSREWLDSSKSEERIRRF